MHYCMFLAMLNRWWPPCGRHGVELGGRANIKRTPMHHICRPPWIKGNKLWLMHILGYCLMRHSPIPTGGCSSHFLQTSVKFYCSLGKTAPLLARKSGDFPFFSSPSVLSIEAFPRFFEAPLLARKFGDFPSFSSPSVLSIEAFPRFFEAPLLARKFGDFPSFSSPSVLSIEAFPRFFEAPLLARKFGDFPSFSSPSVLSIEAFPRFFEAPLLARKFGDFPSFSSPSVLSIEAFPRFFEAPLLARKSGDFPLLPLFFERYCGVLMLVGWRWRSERLF
ncbi:hypothetical protein KFK09_029450 [Dendrobium nobile]|uniref:Uncharacterized protein n=1 Tax=Dendrobium nobile TaxID=94219 RepID=A0A8T3A0X5_DENNO|nr:hypothetical protein KFK09_029450 [Dendrobium nobile]